jgi:hypothetical protein
MTSSTSLSLHCRTALKLVPHSSFTFAKLWLLAAKLEAMKTLRLQFQLRLSCASMRVQPCLYHFITNQTKIPTA